MAARFFGIDLMIESVPKAKTLLLFRHLMERESLAKVIFIEINVRLS